MGSKMCENLLKHKQQVTVFDINTAAVKKAESLGAHKASSPAAVAATGADVIITMLPSTPHAKQVYTGDDGVLSEVKRGALLVDASTIDPTGSRELALAAADKGAAFIDAPVSGGAPLSLCFRLRSQ